MKKGRDLTLPLGINLLGITTVFLALNLLPPEIPIFFGSPVGEAQLGQKFTLFIPSVSSLIFTVTNHLISLRLSGTYFKKVLATTSLAVSILALITTIKVMFLVGNLP